MKLFLFFTVVFCSWSTYGQDFDTLSKGKIIVNVSNIRSDTGQIYLFIYNYENQYPKTPYTFYKVSKKNIVNGNVVFELPIALYYGEYALTLVDDENSNDLLDRKFGVPTEGYGFSNNEKPTVFYLPKYQELLFDLSVPEVELEMEVQYLFN